jgi:hypothetical protein
MDQSLSPMRNSVEVGCLERYEASFASSPVADSVISTRKGFAASTRPHPKIAELPASFLECEFLDGWAREDLR